MGGGVTKIMVVLMVVVVVVSAASATGPTAAQCHEEKRLAFEACGSLLNGGFPSPQCCHRAKVSHAKCICPEITPAVKNRIGDVNRAIRLIKSCGRRVPHHFKCGSVTTP